MYVLRKTHRNTNLNKSNEKSTVYLRYGEAEIVTITDLRSR